MTAILIVEDHPMFLSGMRSVLQALGDVTVHEATSAEAALAVVEDEPALDFICLDMQLPGEDGLDFLDTLRQRRIAIPVVVVSANEAPDIVHRALLAGATGYLSKAAGRDELLAGFRSVLRGGRYVSASLRRPLDDFRSGMAPPGEGGIQLTRRQRQVLELIADGASNGLVAETLGIAESTVKGHVATLFSLLDADNRTSCVAEARRRGILY